MLQLRSCVVFNITFCVRVYICEIFHYLALKFYYCVVCYVNINVLTVSLQGAFKKIVYNQIPNVYSCFCSYTGVRFFEY